MLEVLMIFYDYDRTSLVSHGVVISHDLYGYSNQHMNQITLLSNVSHRCLKTGQTKRRQHMKYLLMRLVVEEAIKDVKIGFKGRQLDFTLSSGFIIPLQCTAPITERPTIKIDKLVH
ncbi:hypothetical protein J6590_049749 [Homalodisca vitripennis]|nr:hypothetical protein J6590_049749 [Homalodisca vitripennis]